MVKKKYKNSDEARAAIIAHAWKDPEFKAKLLKNPRAAFKEMGIDLPEEIDVRVVEEKANTLTFVLPRAAVNVAELSEKELQKVAGGTCFAPGGDGALASVAQSFAVGHETDECGRIIGSRGPRG